MITSNTSPMPPVATPRKAARIVKPSKPPVIAGTPKPKFAGAAKPFTKKK